LALLHQIVMTIPFFAGIFLLQQRLSRLQDERNRLALAAAGSTQHTHAGESTVVAAPLAATAIQVVSFRTGGAGTAADRPVVNTVMADSANPSAQPTNGNNGESMQLPPAANGDRASSARVRSEQIAPAAVTDSSWDSEDAAGNANHAKASRQSSEVVVAGFVSGPHARTLSVPPPLPGFYSNNNEQPTPSAAKLRNGGANLAHLGLDSTRGGDFMDDDGSCLSDTQS